MQRPDFDERYAGGAARNYERYFVPAVGRPAAGRLLEAAELQAGEHVLDVACGTGVVARMAREAVGPGAKVAGLDVNAAMLEVAREVTPAAMDIEWIESPAEDMPIEDGSRDVALCGMGLQFFGDREAGLHEMRRVLTGDGRAVLSLPGPVPPVFQAFERGLANHVGPQAARFASAVFSLHDPDEIRDLARGAGFGAVRIESAVASLPVSPPEQFLWEYVHSTPLADALAAAGAEHRAELEREVCGAWREFVDDGRLVLEVNMTTVVATD